MKDAFASALLRILEASQNEVGVSRSLATRFFWKTARDLFELERAEAHGGAAVTTRQ
jgi:hypothetical protein